MANLKLEALASGIAFLNKFHDPSSDSFHLRNPGLVKAYSYRHLGEVDNKGRRIFPSIIGGFRFLIYDLECKCSGNTRAKGYKGKLSASDSLSDLLKSYNLDSIEDGNIFVLIEFLNKALPGIDITAQTQLSFFVKEN